jgi:Glycerol-3-phosphate dehydrogenase
MSELDCATCRVAAIGAGNFGPVIVHIVISCGMLVQVWLPVPDCAQELARTSDKRRYVPGDVLHEGIKPVMDLTADVPGATLGFIPVPTSSIEGGRYGV